MHGPHGHSDSRPEPTMGATYTRERTEFSVFAPTADQVTLVVADKPSGSRGLREHPCKPVGRGIHESIVDGDLAGKYYAYKLAGRGFDPAKEIIDVYAVCSQN